jgi:GntR family transcriptional repressor for pyruvate dehydrogenase complex
LLPLELFSSKEFIYTADDIYRIIQRMSNNTELKNSLFTPVETETIVQRIIGQVSRSLIRGDLNPGDRLPPEPELAEQIGVSRTALREALKTLAGLGVIHSKRRGGTFIATSFSEAMFNPLVFSLIIEKASKEEILELRILMEVDALELAMEKGNKEDFFQLEQELDQFEKAMVAGDTDALSELDVRFHLHILEMSRNSAFIRIGRTVMQLFAFPIGRALKVLGPKAVLNSHRELLGIMRKKDLQAIREHVRSSFERSVEFF